MACYLLRLFTLTHMHIRMYNIPKKDFFKCKNYSSFLGKCSNFSKFFRIHPPPFFFFFFSKSHISYNFTINTWSGSVMEKDCLNIQSTMQSSFFNKINSSSGLFWLDLFLNHLGHLSIDIALSFNMCLSNSSSVLWCSFTLGLSEPIIRHRIFYFFNQIIFDNMFVTNMIEAVFRT